MAESETPESHTQEVSSVLSDKQRRWLKGEDVFDSPDRVVRSRIRDRYEQAFSDLALLHNTDRMNRQELMKSVRDGSSSSTSNDNADKGLASEGKINEEDIADIFDSGVAQLETASGTPIEDFDLKDMITQVRRVKGEYGQLDDDTVLMFAVMGAVAGLMGTGKTEKQVRQWIEHHWPDEEEAMGQLEEAQQFLG